MKYLPLFFLPFLVNAQGVKWESSLSEAFREARRQEKILFVEFYSPGCPHCQRIAPFFKEKEVADLYNLSFVNYQLNVETEEGRKFAESAGLDVYGIPYFLFFRADSSLVHAREVSASLSSVLQPGKMVTEKTYTGENYARRFAAGERSENFLTHFALFSRVKKDTLTNKSVVDALWEIFPAEKRNSATSWIILKKGLMDAENGFADYWLENAALAASFETAPAQGAVENAFSRLLYGTIFSSRTQNFTAAQWKTLREKFAPVLGEGETRSLVWEKEFLACLKEDNSPQALELARQMAEQYRHDAAGLAYVADVAEKNCDACRESAARWKDTARALQK